jgi:hypothetical protein
MGAMGHFAVRSKDLDNDRFGSNSSDRQAHDARVMSASRRSLPKFGAAANRRGAPGADNLSLDPFSTIPRRVSSCFKLVHAWLFATMNAPSQFAREG